jgi:hypothetical protein
VLFGSNANFQGPENDLQQYPHPSLLSTPLLRSTRQLHLRPESAEGLRDQVRTAYNLRDLQPVHNINEISRPEDLTTGSTAQALNSLIGCAAVSLEPQRAYIGREAESGVTLARH